MSRGRGEREKRGKQGQEEGGTKYNKEEKMRGEGVRERDEKIEKGEVGGREANG